MRQWWRARDMVARLGEPDISVETIEAAARCGRATLPELFRLLTSAEDDTLRRAAGRAIAILWANDELIVEEEKALVLRGYSAQWRARRKYPRAFQAPIPISVSYGVPFLPSQTPDPKWEGVSLESLEWSHRVLGTRRANLESYTPWTSGSPEASFELIPGDFDGNGPHRLVLHARVRTVGLTENWMLELPQIPFSLEFDPHLQTDALFALADEARHEHFQRSIQLVRPPTSSDESSAFLSLDQEFALRNPPILKVETPLPCDLAHILDLEIEGAVNPIRAGGVVLSGQGGRAPNRPRSHEFPLELKSLISNLAIEKPGQRRIRAILTPDSEKGWGNPDIRSIWPERIVTDWTEVELVRL